MKYLSFCLMISYIFLSIKCFSHVEKYEVLNSKIESFDFKYVCRFMGYKSLLLVDSIDENKLDCMGKTVAINKFCKKKFPDANNLLRGFINSKDRKVSCQKGNALILKYGCGIEKETPCRSSLKSCRYFKKIYSLEPELIHHSILDDADGNKFINCYYSIFSDTQL